MTGDFIEKIGKMLEDQARELGNHAVLFMVFEDKAFDILTSQIHEYATYTNEKYHDRNGIELYTPFGKLFIYRQHHSSFNTACSVVYSSKPKEVHMSNFVLVRTFSAGVHFGRLEGKAGKELTLLDARRIWRWRGANTLSELSQSGADMEWTKISEPVPSITLTEAIEIIPCSAKAIENLSVSRWEK